MTGPFGGGGDNTNNPNDPFGTGPGGGGNTTNPFGNGAPNSVNTPASQLANKAGAGFFGPLTTMFASFQAKSFNTANQIINTAFYGGLAVSGFLVCAYGLYQLTKDIPVLGDSTKAAGSILSAAKRAAELMVVA